MVYSIVDITIERIAQELASLAFFDVIDFFAADGTLRPLQDIPVEARRAIAGIEISTSRKLTKVTNIKLCDKLRALQALGRWKQMFVDRVELGRSSEPERLSKLTNEKLDAKLIEQIAHAQKLLQHSALPEAPPHDFAKPDWGSRGTRRQG